ncbi:hypothetical protein EASAB2608_00542 [Streptomyces sp. EAS-AB2608]|nr:hypothetical protein EASAB2608_00542 [Streptomyces sp. EAS-AB2608]
MRIVVGRGAREPAFTGWARHRPQQAAAACGAHMRGHLVEDVDVFRPTTAPVTARRARSSMGEGDQVLAAGGGPVVRTGRRDGATTTAGEEIRGSAHLLC